MFELVPVCQLSWLLLIEVSMAWMQLPTETGHPWTKSPLPANKWLVKSV